MIYLTFTLRARQIPQPFLDFLCARLAGMAGSRFRSNYGHSDKNSESSEKIFLPVRQRMGTIISNAWSDCRGQKCISCDVGLAMSLKHATSYEDPMALGEATALVCSAYENDKAGAVWLIIFSVGCWSLIELQT
jgi:hypothetical protein